MLMAICLLVLGAVIGMAIRGPDGGMLGLMIATGIWIVMTLISFSAGDQILLAASNAVSVTHDVHPQLFNVVEEMSIASGLPMPKVYIINDPAPNAFATGRNPKTASIAVTAGLLGKLNRDELQGVMAHEMSHILHRDILFVTLAGIMLGSVALLSQVFLRGMMYGGGSRRRYSSGGDKGGGAAAILLIIALVVAILAPIVTQLLYFALSRKREYLADAGAVRLTRYPEGLASALEKIANDHAPQLASANKVTAPMFIVNPLKKMGAVESVGPDEHASAYIGEDTDFAEHVAGSIVEGLFGRVCKCDEKQDRFTGIGVNERGHRPEAGKRGGQESADGKSSFTRSGILCGR